MSFENLFANDLKGGINAAQYVRNSKARPHVSKSKLDLYSNVEYVSTGELKATHYSSGLEPRFLAATDLTYDVVLVVYDVNRSRVLAYRLFKDMQLLEQMEKSIASMKRERANLEARIIGLQDNEESIETLRTISAMLLKIGAKLVEVDLFGKSVRHIAIDTKLGMSLDILMEDRAYRPGELVNMMTMENFEASLRKGKGRPQSKRSGSPM